MCEYVRLPDVDEVVVCCRRFPPLWTTSSSRLVLAIEQRTFITTLLPGTAGSGVCPGAWLPLASVIFVTKSMIRAISTLKEMIPSEKRYKKNLVSSSVDIIPERCATGCDVD